MRCAIYTRVSTEDQAQTGYSLDSQKRALAELAAERRYTVVLAESDDLSGTILDRPGLARIREAAATHLVDAVLVFDPDRLTRKLGHLLLLQEEFERLGVRLEFRTQDPVKTSEDRLLLNVRGIIAEYEREKIRERTLRGRKEKARRGLWCGGPAPYGYEYAPPGILTISAAEAPVIRSIYAWAEAGVSVRQIADRLTASDARPRRNHERWQHSTINRILRSELYVGRAYYLRRKPLTNGETVRQMRDESEWIRLACPAIVPEKQWQAVQERIERNRTLLAGRPSHSYLLRGLVRCECGARMGGDASKGTRRYRCLARCGAVMTQAATLEAAVYESLAASVGSPEALGALVAKHIDRLRRSERGADTLRRRIDLMRKKEERGARALIHAGSDTEEAALRDELGKVRSARQECERRLAEIGSADEALASVESARREIAAALRLVAQDEALRREFITRLVQEVRVRGKHIEVRCKLSTTARRSGQFSFTVCAEVA